MTSEAKILVFDSENAERLAWMVKRLTGREVVCKSDLAGVIEDIKAEKFELLILDLCDFYCRELADEFHNRLPGKVLFLTCGEDIHNYFLPTGTEVVLTKPIEVEKFVSKVRELLGERVQ